MGSKNLFNFRAEFLVTCRVKICSLTLKNIIYPVLIMIKDILQSDAN